MEYRQLGSLFEVSRLVLGGGGLGQVWGNTTRAEATATLHAAVEAGINLLDMAPLYGDGEAETVVGEAFNGQLPPGVRVATKCLLGDPPAAEVLPRLRASLEASLTRLRLPRVDLFLLHGLLAPNGWPQQQRGGTRYATSWDTYTEAVRPAMHKLAAEGLIGAWGLSGVGVPRTLLGALRDHPRPRVVQCVANLLDSAGAMHRFEAPARPRELIRAAAAEGVGVLGIRIVQAGALTAALDRSLPADHPEQLDFARAAPFRALAAELGQDPADLATRYALGIPGVDAVVLGVKNRDELSAALEAAAAGPLEAALRARIDALGLTRIRP